MADLQGESWVWELGEVEKEGGYAYSLAKAPEAVEMERGFVMLLATQNAEEMWQAVAPGMVSETEYNQLLQSFPDSLLNEFDKSYYYQYTSTEVSRFSTRTVDLHKFPWPVGLRAKVTQKDGDYHTNQIDFYMLDADTIYASKPGVVIYAKESSNTGGCNMDYWQYANVVVIQHSGSEYSWYFHLKQNSVTVEVGDMVGYGTKIGEQGNTGYACGTTGIHLHFMVSTAVPSYWPNAATASLAPWPPGGSIIRVNFSEASWTAIQEYQTYVSLNAPVGTDCGVDVDKVAVYDNTYCDEYLTSTGSIGLVELDTIGLDEKAESIEIPDGWSVKLYKNPNEMGGSLCVNGSDLMLWDDTFSEGTTVANQLSWFRVYRSENCPVSDESVVKLFGKVDFDGSILWGMYGTRFTNGPQQIAKSIKFPQGYSVKLWDQDGMQGNMLCLSASAPDLAAFGWSNKTIQSIQFAAGDICDPQSNTSGVPALLSPADSETSLGYAAPKLCWQGSDLSGGEQYEVSVTGTSSISSGWISDTCWRPSDIDGNYESYSWQVRQKDSGGTVGAWSAARDFTMTADEQLPTLTIKSPQLNDIVVRPRTNIIVDANDEGGIDLVQFLAWYDDGKEGFNWHYVGTDDSKAGGWKVVWDLTQVKSDTASIWVQALDNSGNLTSQYVPDLIVRDTVPVGDGFNSKDGAGGGGEDEEKESAAPAPETPIKEEPNDQEKPENTKPVAPPSAPVVVQPSNTETESSVKAAAPMVLQPQNKQVYYGMDFPKICWLGNASSSGMTYQVKLEGEGENLTSAWTRSACWQPAELEKSFGSYAWQVRSKSSSGQESEWSELQSFEWREDLNPPAVQMEMMSDGLHIESVPLTFEVHLAEPESVVEDLYFMGWYDDGDGYQWHVIEKVADPLEDEIIVWDASVYAGQNLQVWVYAKDSSGNYGSAQFSVVQPHANTDADAPASQVTISANQKHAVDTVYIEKYLP